jgi:hypothetical protein
MSNKPNAHFYLSSCAQWCTTGTTRTLSEAIKLMDKDKLTYVIWFVPCAADADYEINFYAPQVDGAFPVELIEFKNGRRVKSIAKENADA